MGVTLKIDLYDMDLCGKDILCELVSGICLALYTFPACVVVLVELVVVVVVVVVVAAAVAAAAAAAVVVVVVAAVVVCGCRVNVNVVSSWSLWLSCASYRTHVRHRYLYVCGPCYFIAVILADTLLQVLITMRADIVGDFEPCVTDIYLHIDARMADYIRTRP
eukprot:COSAG05_NODE_2688_length_2769_cov_4.603371_4_plen_163_part_00